MFEKKERPKVGLGIIIINEEKILLGKRKNSHGAEEWALPGGHIERYESFEECAYRENDEETGIEIKLIYPYPVAATNDIFEKENKHYITTFMKAKYISGEPKILEPDKCEEWDWFYWHSLPKPLFLPVRNLIKQGYNPFI